MEMHSSLFLSAKRKKNLFSDSDAKRNVCCFFVQKFLQRQRCKERGKIRKYYQQRCNAEEQKVYYDTNIYCLQKMQSKGIPFPA